MKAWMKLSIPVTVAAVVLLTLSQASRSQMATTMPMAMGNHNAAIAVITPTGANKAQGTVKFTKVAAGVQVVADVTGLTPGKHGFHIHEFGDISDAKAGMATGGHYGAMIPWETLPGEAAHPAGTMHHAGEMGNLEADATGHAHMEVVLPGVTLEGPDAIVGRSIIVHADPDMGDRIGQGVIGIANPASMK
jgi:Cu-Zn family superoxide dismutase